MIYLGLHKLIPFSSVVYSKNPDYVTHSSPLVRRSISQTESDRLFSLDEESKNISIDFSFLNQLCS
jgi:hypothetical protein